MLLGPMKSDGCLWPGCWRCSFLGILVELVALGPLIWLIA